MSLNIIKYLLKILFSVSKQINKYYNRSKMSLKIIFTIELYVKM